MTAGQAGRLVRKGTTGRTGLLGDVVVMKARCKPLPHMHKGKQDSLLFSQASEQVAVLLWVCDMGTG